MIDFNCDFNWNKNTQNDVLYFVVLDYKLQMTDDHNPKDHL